MLMTPTDPASSVTASPSLGQVRVWDLPVRLVHWSIVVLLAALLVTGLVGDEWLIWHMRFGQAMLALVVFRVLWGFVGSRNARFSAFLRGPGEIVRYVRSFTGRHERHATHNPLGGWMVVLLLVALLVQAAAGLFTNDDVLYGGPLSERVTKDTSDAISVFHRRFWWVVATLSAVHIVAVLAYLGLWKDNLIVPMLTGYKALPEGAGTPEDAAASTVKATALLVACGLAVWYVANRV